MILYVSSKHKVCHVTLSHNWKFERNKVFLIIQYILLMLVKYEAGSNSTIASVCHISFFLTRIDGLIFFCEYSTYKGLSYDLHGLSVSPQRHVYICIFLIVILFPKKYSLCPFVHINFFLLRYFWMLSYYVFNNFLIF